MVLLDKEGAGYGYGNGHGAGAGDGAVYLIKSISNLDLNALISDETSLFFFGQKANL